MRFDVEMNNKEHWSLEGTNPQADTFNEEAAIDELVYQLYEMTEDEIRMVENRE